MSKNFIIFLIVLVLIIAGILFWLMQRSATTPRPSPGPILDKEDLEQEVTEEPGQEALNMKLLSSVFENQGNIPLKYTCDGEDVSPPLEIEEVPQNAKSLVLIIDDPDAPGGSWIHWLLWNIDPAISAIEENTVPQGAVQGINSFGNNNYGGPCPPRGTHHYVFTLYALDTSLDIPATSQKEEVESAMAGHILEQSQLTGLYQRQ